MQNSATATERSPGEFRTPILIDRASEALHIVDFLSRPETRMAVIFGHPNSGKSTLVRDFVRPAMPDPNAAFFGVTAPDLPREVESAAGALVPLISALSSGGTVFLDEFDQLLSAGGKKRMLEVSALLSQVHRGELRGRLVLIVQEENLSQLLTFRSNAPDLLDNTYEVKALPLEEHIRRLGAEGGAAALAYSQEVIDRLRVDLVAFGAAGSCDIAEAVDCGFRHYKRASDDRLITAEDYKDAGFLSGIVRRCLEARMLSADEQFGEGAGRVTLAIAEEVAEAGRTALTPDFQEIAPRLSVSRELSDHVLAWAAGPGRLLFTDPAGTLRLVPRELARILEAEAEPRRRELDQARDILNDGVRSKEHLGTVLPRDRFDTVNRVRTRLKTTDQQTTLLVNSSLYFQDVTSDTVYWLGRIADPEGRTSVLIGALFSDSVQARLNAATLLADFDDPEVRSQLYRKALEDPEPAVRERSIDSLSCTRTEEFWPLLEKEAKDHASPYRENAIAAIRLCTCERCVATLREIVGNPDEDRLRESAIHTLAAMNLPAAADTLVSIGLDHEDPQIRAVAASSLASLRWPGLVARALETTRTATLKIDEGGWDLIRRPLGTAAGFFLALALTALNFVVHGVALLPLKRYRWTAAFVSMEILWVVLLIKFNTQFELEILFLLLWLANWMISHLIGTRFVLLEGGRSTRMLGGVLFAFCFGSLLLFHGSAHALIGRWRRAARLFVAEAAGLGLIALAVYAFQDYKLGHHLTERIFYSFFWFYVFAGAAFFLASFWFDTKDIFYERCYLADRGEARQRKADLIEKLLATPAGTQSALEMAESPDLDVGAWARNALVRCASGASRPDLIARFESLRGIAPKFLRRALAKNQTDETVEALTEFWDQHSSDSGVKRNILGVLLAEPSEQSLRKVDQRLRRLTLPERIRYRAAKSWYAVRLWPRTVRWAAVLMIPFVIYSLSEAFMSVRSPAHTLVHHMRSNLQRPWTRENGVLTANFLAKVYAEDSALEIIELYNNAKSKANANPKDTQEAKFRDELGESLAVLACADLKEPGHSELRNALGSPQAILRTFIKARETGCPNSYPVAQTLVQDAKPLLGSSSVDDTRLALKALETAGAVPELAAFAKRPVAETRVKDLGKALALQQARRQDVALKMEAVDALIRIGSTDAFQELQSAMDTSQAPEIRDQIAHRLRAIPAADPLGVVQTAFERADYERVVNEGQVVRNSKVFAGLAAEQASRLFAMLGESKYRLSLDPTRPGKPELEDEALDLLGRSFAIRNDRMVARTVAEIHNGRAERLRVQGKFKEGEALREVAAGIAADATFAQVYGTKGSILLDQEKPELALAEFVKATQLDPSYAWAWCMQAQVRLDAREYNAAQQLAKRAIKAAPTYSWSYYLLYQSYVERPGDPLAAAAIADFEQLQRDYPGIYWPARQLANLYHDHWPVKDAAGQRAGLKKSYEQWLDLDRKFSSKLDPATLLNHRANFLESRFTFGQYAVALQQGKELGRQLAHDPDYQIPVVLLTYASALIMEDRKTAGEQFAMLQTALGRLEKNHKAPWDYAGTITHLNNTFRDRSWKKPLIGLLEAASNMQQRVPIPGSVIEENRQMLATGK